LPGQATLFYTKICVKLKYLHIYNVLVKIVDKFQSEIRILNVCKSNSNLNFKIEVRKFELHFTSLRTALTSVIATND